VNTELFQPAAGILFSYHRGHIQNHQQLLTMLVTSSTVDKLINGPPINPFSNFNSRFLKSISKFGALPTLTKTFSVEISFPFESFKNHLIFIFLYTFNSSFEM